MPDISKKIDGKKYMWDGSEYETGEDAKKAQDTYKNDNFESELIDEDGKYLVEVYLTVSQADHRTGISGSPDILEVQVSDIADSIQHVHIRGRA